MPIITVVITTYNLENIIGKCLSELFSQTFQNFNVLIVDDCSEDKTADIIKGYANLYPKRVQTVFLTENTGSPSRTRNIALDSGKINGDYVIFLDGDDSIEPIFLETLYALACKTQAEISVCAYNRVRSETGRVLCSEMREFPEVLNLPADTGILAFVNSSLWNKLIKTSVIDAIRIPDFKIGEDLCFLHKLYQKCERIAFTKKILIHYQVRRNSVINNAEPETVYAFANELKNMYTDCSCTDLRETIALLTFVHIGISMPVRIKNNPSVSTRKHLKWTRRYFKNNYNFFKDSDFLKFASLTKHGIRGLALWCCLKLYKLYLFGLFLFFYEIYTKLFNKDIKF